VEPVLPDTATGLATELELLAPVLPVLVADETELTLPESPLWATGVTDAVEPPPPPEVAEATPVPINRESALKRATRTGFIPTPSSSPGHL
jgi:hypothetical protein